LQGIPKSESSSVLQMTPHHFFCLGTTENPANFIYFYMFFKARNTKLHKKQLLEQSNCSTKKQLFDIWFNLKNNSYIGAKILNSKLNLLLPTPIL
jgi:hypothetical protein